MKTVTVHAAKTHLFAPHREGRGRGGGRHRPRKGPRRPPRPGPDRKAPATLRGLPPLHRDPFDRMLVAQALLEGLPLLTNDVVFDAYGTRRIW